MVFNERLVELRKLTGMTQKSFAESINVDISKYNKWEKGVNRPDYETICKLADLFNTSTDYLLGRDVNSIQNNSQLLSDDLKNELNILNANIIDTIAKFQESKTELSQIMPAKVIRHLKNQLTAFDNLLTNVEKTSKQYFVDYKFDKDSTDDEYVKVQNEIVSCAVDIERQFEDESRFSQVDGLKHLGMRVVLDRVLRFNIYPKFIKETGREPKNIFLDDIF